MMRSSSRPALFALAAVAASAPALAQDAEVPQAEERQADAPQSPRERHPSADLDLQDCKREWFDAARLQELVDATVPLVEEHAKLQFEQRPVVRVLNAESWQRLVASEMPDARDPSLVVAITLALHVPERGEVFLNQPLAYELLRAREGDKEELRRIAQATLAHELAHVLQEQHFELPSRMRAARSGDDKRKLKFLVEGHATLIEERVAIAEFGIEGYAEWSRKRHLKARRMAYTRGRDYLANLAEDGGERAIHEALGGPLPSWPAFVKVAMRKPKKPREDVRKR